ncbi:hypothetical protein TNCV_5074661 [Trichonephila clavipes]|nr:hypothetical protein TNCV_5074661 [Trichonephila clavipes]
MKSRRITNSYNKSTEIPESTPGGKKPAKTRRPTNVESPEHQSHDPSLSDTPGTQKDHTFHITSATNTTVTERRRSQIKSVQVALETIMTSEKLGQPVVSAKMMTR